MKAKAIVIVKDKSTRGRIANLEINWMIFRDSQQRINMVGWPRSGGALYACPPALLPTLLVHACPRAFFTSKDAR